MANSTDLNVWAGSGRIVRDIGDIKYSATGTAIVNFSIAVNRWKKGGSATSFFDCTYFGKAAEGVSPYLKKGQQVNVSGSLEQQTWGEGDNKRSRIIINVSSVSLIGGGNKDQIAPVENEQPKQPYDPYKKKVVQTQSEEDYTDDIPF